MNVFANLFIQAAENRQDRRSRRGRIGPTAFHGGNLYEAPVVPLPVKYKLQQLARLGQGTANQFVAQHHQE